MQDDTIRPRRRVSPPKGTKPIRDTKPLEWTVNVLEFEGKHYTLAFGKVYAVTVITGEDGNQKADIASEPLPAKEAQAIEKYARDEHYARLREES